MPNFFNLPVLDAGIFQPVQYIYFKIKDFFFLEMLYNHTVDLNPRGRK